MAEAVRPEPDVAGEVLRRTHQLWDDRAVGLIYTQYAHNVQIHQDVADQIGQEAVVTDAIRTLAAFPDLRLVGHEVIWSGNAQDGVHSSHRAVWCGHHLGHGRYGPPTGGRIHCRVITQQDMRGGRVVQEWRVRDELAVIRQLGLDGWALARSMAEADGVHTAGFGELARGHGQRPPPTTLDGDPADPEALPGLLYGLVWNGRMFNLLRTYYADDAVIWVPGHRRLATLQARMHYVLQLLAAFSDGAMQLEQVTWTGTEPLGFRIAARWTFQGTHDGPGLYGAPTGRRVRVMGISHFEVRGGRIVRESMLWNEFALLVQLSRPG
ncbi:ester cyclase [Deinococcus sonorensis]|uniref:Ester cyclase n=2 Tax=Deinococcus sonorensis TaxID=309891 RepID=A0AAU7UFW1_9DEIO